VFIEFIGLLGFDEFIELLGLLGLLELSGYLSLLGSLSYLSLLAFLFCIPQSAFEKSPYLLNVQSPHLAIFFIIPLFPHLPISLSPYLFLSSFDLSTSPR
jgi:hypothetical protein